MYNVKIVFKYIIHSKLNLPMGLTSDDLERKSHTKVLSADLFSNPYST